MSSKIPYQRLVSEVDRDSLSKKVISKIKLLSARKSVFPHLMGSYVYRYQKYPGDIDLVENFKDCCSKKDVIRKFAKKIKIIVRDIGNSKINYITEFKMGLDNRYDVALGTLDQGIYLPDKDVNKFVSDNNKLLPSSEKNIIREILKKKEHGGDDYDTINHIFREHRILRWRIEDLKNGYLLLSNGGGKMSIEEALNFKTTIKVDTVTIIDGRFTEITNFWYLSYNKEDGTEIPINTDFLAYPSDEGFHNEFVKAIKEDIEKMRFSKAHFNPFKMAKRMWTLARILDDREVIDKLSTFITGNISELYQMKSEISAILSIWEFTTYNPIEVINAQVDRMKYKIAKIIQLSQQELNTFDNAVDKFVKSSSKNTASAWKKKIDKLHDIGLFINKIVDNEAVYQLQKTKLYIPPRNLLPNNLHYISEDQYNNYITSYGGELDNYYTTDQQNAKFKDMRDYYMHQYFSTIFDNDIYDHLDYSKGVQSSINEAISDIEKLKNQGY